MISHASVNERTGSRQVMSAVPLSHLPTVPFHAGLALTLLALHDVCLLPFADLSLLCALRPHGSHPGHTHDTDPCLPDSPYILSPEGPGSKDPNDPVCPRQRMGICF